MASATLTLMLNYHECVTITTVYRCVAPSSQRQTVSAFWFWCPWTAGVCVCMCVWTLRLVLPGFLSSSGTLYLINQTSLMLALWKHYLLLLVCSVSASIGPKAYTVYLAAAADKFWAEYTSVMRQANRASTSMLCLSKTNCINNIYSLCRIKIKMEFVEWMELNFRGRWQFIKLM